LPASVDQLSTGAFVVADTERAMGLRKIGFWLMVALLVAGGALVASSLYRTAVLGSGVMAQLLCSSTFVSGRDPEAVVTEDLSGPGYEPLSFFSVAGRASE
jgi:hypothetical protein